MHIIVVFFGGIYGFVKWLNRKEIKENETYDNKQLYQLIIGVLYLFYVGGLLLQFEYFYVSRDMFMMSLYSIRTILIYTELKKHDVLMQNYRLPNYLNILDRMVVALSALHVILYY